MVLYYIAEFHLLFKKLTIVYLISVLTYCSFNYLKTAPEEASKNKSKEITLTSYNQILTNFTTMESCPLRPSFIHIPQQNDTIANQHLIFAECKRISAVNEPINVSDFDAHLLSTPYFQRLFLSLYYTLTKRTMGQRYASNDQANNFSFFNSNLKTKIFKQMGGLIQKKLFYSDQLQKFYEEVSFSLSYKESLLPYFISLLSQNTSCFPLQKISGFYRIICSQQYILYVPIQLYYLYGGSLFTIQAKVFKQKVLNLIQSLSQVLANSDTLINRNVDQFKNNKQRKLVLEQSLKVVMLSKNKQTLFQVVQEMCTSIFKGRQYLNKEQFLYQIQSKPLDPLLSIFILFLRSEYMMFEERIFQNILTNRRQISSTNFYAHEMNKLLNKCPFNGDERCNCKKCQCVRRNRQSAKINQQKKRNAVEQVEAFKRRVEEWEGKQRGFKKQIAELRQQNLMLKTLLKKLKQNPSVKEIMREAIEPINKVLNNNL